MLCGGWLVDHLHSMIIADIDVTTRALVTFKQPQKKRAHFFGPMVIILEAFQNQCSMQWYNTKPCFSPVWAGLDQARHSLHSNVDKMEL